MEQDSPDSLKAYPLQIEGMSLNTGAGFGIAVVHPSGGTSGGIKTTQSHPPLEEALPSFESNCLKEALHKLDTEIQSLISHSFSSDPNTDCQDILNVYLLLARDPSWQKQLFQAVSEGHSATKAIDITFNSIKDKLNQVDAASFWKERISDFEDLSLRLKKQLSSSQPTSKPSDQSNPIILVADRIGPAELLDYNRGNLAGLVLIEQSQTSHVAIVARSLKIPVVGVTKNRLNEIHNGDPLLIDGNEGCVYIRPESDFINRFEGLTPSRAAGTLEQPFCSKTLDGVSISLLLNAGLVEDVDHIEAAGAEGIGLYRTEISFMMTHKFLNVIDQTKLYQEIIHRAKNYPVVFRTLDVGGDKVLPYLERLQSENPKKQERVTKVFFDRSLLLQYQLRALIRACSDRDLTIMLPMVAEVEEVITARAILRAEIEREKSKGKPVPKCIKLGAMIEVPSLVYQLPQLFQHVDFLSVGTNDLFQFFFGLDRDYPKLTDRYDVLSPIFLNYLKTIQEQCHAANMPLSICGEMAGRPIEALALMGLGYRTLSMSAAAAPLVKKMICGLSYKHIADYMAKICRTSQGNIRDGLQQFAKDHGIHWD